MSEQAQWTDERIAERIDEIDNEFYALHNGDVRVISHYIFVAKSIAWEVRDDLTAQLAAAQADNAQLRTERDVLRDTRQGLRSKLAGWLWEYRRLGKQFQADCDLITSLTNERDALKAEVAEWKRKATARPDWHMPDAPACTGCGNPLVPMAYATGEGWLLHWGCDYYECPKNGDTFDDELGDKAYIDWPFGDDKIASAAEMEALGFEVI